MSIAVSYEKYEYMTKRQIFTALLNAEKKYEKIKNDLEIQKSLVSFLKAKSKKKIDEVSYTPNDETIQAIKECESKKNSGVILNSIDEFKAYNQRLKQEVANEN